MTIEELDEAMRDFRARAIPSPVGLSETTARGMLHTLFVRAQDVRSQTDQLRMALDTGKLERQLESWYHRPGLEIVQMTAEVERRIEAVEEVLRVLPESLYDEAVQILNRFRLNEGKATG